MEKDPDVNETSIQRCLELKITPTLPTTSHPSRRGERSQMQPQLLKTSPQNTSKTTGP
ncbi:MAG: hypothetical protein EZS28_049671, partial [Streblomastix strix]